MLPQTSTMCEKQTISLPSSLQGIERREVQSFVHEIERQRDGAVRSAQLCRDIAEKLKTENRTLKEDMIQKVETQRDFWRNKILEGQSRSGRMVKMALLSQARASKEL